MPRESAGIDWVGVWFEFVASMGEFTQIRIGKRPFGTDEVEWSFVEHSRCDGIGAFAEVVRATGDAPLANELPTMRETSLPARWRRWLGFLRQSFATRVRPAVWRGWNAAWSPPATCPEAIAATVFDHEETTRIVTLAHESGVSPNSWLLAALVRALMLELGPGANHWMIPVNLRGPIRLPRETSNHASYLQIEIPRAARPSDVHQLVTKSLNRADHWGVWDMLNVGRFIGLRWTRRLFDAGQRSGNVGWVGTFSNLGMWDRIGPNTTDWFFCPPVNRTLPIAAGALTCNGRLSLSIQGHPALTTDRARAEAWLTRWLLEAGIERQARLERVPGDANLEVSA